MQDIVFGMFYDLLYLIYHDIYGAILFTGSVVLSTIVYAFWIEPKLVSLDYRKDTPVREFIEFAPLEYFEKRREQRPLSGTVLMSTDPQGNTYVNPKAGKILSKLS